MEISPRTLRRMALDGGTAAWTLLRRLGGRRPPRPDGLPAAPPDRMRLSLALQGGGAHGAFTWGVLDRLLEEERIGFDGLSGASAGALNAAAFASGWLAGGRAGARDALGRLWRHVGDIAPRAPALPLGRPAGSNGLRTFAFDLMAAAFSPYQFNPLDLNPLRSVLAETIDFERLRAADRPRLFVSATCVRTGTPRLFRNRELTPDILLASACLPQMHQAVEIDGEAYWDGGFTANPPLLPLIEICDAADILLVDLSLRSGGAPPVTVPEIRRRTGEIAFQTPLALEQAAVALATRVATESETAGPLGRRLLNLRLHRLSIGDSVLGLTAESRLAPDRSMLARLHAAGRAAAETWLGGDSLRRGPPA